MEHTIKPVSVCMQYKYKYRKQIQSMTLYVLETAHSSWCRVMELTEREHLVLSRAEKLHQSITKLSKSTWKMKT